MSMKTAGVEALTQIVNRVKGLLSTKADSDLSNVTPATGRSALGIGTIATINTGDSTTTYLRNDGTWGTPSGGGGASKTDVTVVIAASGWASNVYSFEDDYPSESYDIIDIVPIDGTTTSEMKSAWAKADCYGYNESNVIQAKGTVPTIDLTMKMIVLAK